MIEPVTYYQVSCDFCTNCTATPAPTEALATINAKREGMLVTPAPLKPNRHMCRICQVKEGDIQ